MSLYLAARFLWTYTDRASALAVIERLEGVEVQALDEVEQNTNPVFLNVGIDRGADVVPALLILLATPGGVEMYVASGLHLSSTEEGAQLAFVDGCLDEVIEESKQGDEPLVVAVFELTYHGKIQNVLH